MYAKEFIISVGFDDDNAIQWSHIDYDNISKEELKLLKAAIKHWEKNNKLTED